MASDEAPAGRARILSVYYGNTGPVMEGSEGDLEFSFIATGRWEDVTSPLVRQRFVSFISRNIRDIALTSWQEIGWGWMEVGPPHARDDTSATVYVTLLATREDRRVSLGLAEPVKQRFALYRGRGGSTHASKRAKRPLPRTLWTGRYRRTGPVAVATVDYDGEPPEEQLSLSLGEVSRRGQKAWVSAKGDDRFHLAIGPLTEKALPFKVRSILGDDARRLKLDRVRHAASAGAWPRHDEGILFDGKATTSGPRVFYPPWRRVV